MSNSHPSYSSFALDSSALPSDLLPLHVLNSVNKQLQSQLAVVESQLDAAKSDITENKDRLHFMQDHLGNVQAEIINTQALQEAKKREVKSEDHLCQLIERERARLRQRVQQTMVNHSVIQERLDSIRNAIFQGNLKIDEFKTAMNFNQEQLEQWDIARKQKEDDYAALLKYSAVDEVKIKELNLAIEKLNRSVQEMVNALNNEITATQSAQNELDTGAEDYKMLCSERERLINQWEETVRGMKRRDHGIKAAEKRYAEAQKWIETRSQQLKTVSELCQVEKNRYAELQDTINMTDKLVSKKREELVVLTKEVGDADKEIDVVQATLQKANQERSNAQARLFETQQQLKSKTAFYERTHVHHKATIQRLNDEIAAAADLQRQNKLVQDLFAQSQNTLKSLEGETKTVQDEQFKHNELLNAVRRTQSGLLAEISGIQLRGKNMNDMLKKLDVDSLKQQELLYTIEFNIQQVERKINRAKGECSEDEKRDLSEKIEMLTKILEDLNKQNKVLIQQSKSVIVTLKHSKQTLEGLESDEERFHDMVLSLQLETQSCEKELTAATGNKDETLVDADVVRLQLERLRKQLAMRDGELLGLENRKAQLDITVAEREAEICAHQAVLKMEAKTTEDERRKLAVEVADRQKKAELLKSRYEVFTGRMDPSLADVTQAQLIIKAAKERESLQRRGDVLDSTVKKIERELSKIDKTAVILSGSNIKYREHFHKVQDGDEEVIQKGLLKSKARELQSIISRRMVEIKDAAQGEMLCASELRNKQRNKQDLEERLTIVADAERTLGVEIQEQGELAARCELDVEKSKQTLELEVWHAIKLEEEREGQEDLVRCVLAEIQKSGEGDEGGDQAAAPAVAAAPACGGHVVERAVEVLQRAGVSLAVTVKA